MLRLFVSLPFSLFILSLSGLLCLLCISSFLSVYICIYTLAFCFSVFAYLSFSAFISVFFFSAGISDSRLLSLSRSLALSFSLFLSVCLSLAFSVSDFVCCL